MHSPNETDSIGSLPDPDDCPLVLVLYTSLLDQLYTSSVE